MWKNAEEKIALLSEILPITRIEVLGSFTTKKRRPADVDFIILLSVKEKGKKTKWAVDMEIVPDNAYGEEIIADARKWMKQKYGTNNFYTLSFRFDKYPKDK